MASPTTATLTIDSLGHMGYGVGRVDGVVWFVPYTVPGDTIVAERVSHKQRFVVGRMVSLLTPSPDRVVHRCPHFGTCGGCDWQSTPYSVQLAEKRKILINTFRKAGLNLPTSLIVIESPLEYGYRSRITLHRSCDGRFGFLERGTHRVVPIENCPIAAPELQRRLLELNSDHHNRSEPDNYPGGRLTLHLSDAGEVGESRHGSGEMRGFAQVNEGINTRIKGEIRRIVDERFPGAGIRVVDLYCGNGNLSFPLAEVSSRIRGWDSSVFACREGMKLVRSAEATSRIGWGVVAYTPSPVERAEKAILKELESADLLILDPPRRGLKEVGSLVEQLRVPTIIYLSCSPPTQARDVAKLTAGGYRIEETILFDMFPQTYHMEVLIVLSRLSPDSSHQEDRHEQPSRGASAGRR